MRDCRAVMQLLKMTAFAVKRSPASPYADRDPHSELMITKGTPARTVRVVSNPKTLKPPTLRFSTAHCCHVQVA